MIAWLDGVTDAHVVYAMAVAGAVICIVVAVSGACALFGEEVSRG